MQAPLKDKNDIKIFILYLMTNIGYPLDYTNLNDIIVQDEIVGYFDFAECFSELLEAQCVEEIKIDGNPHYKITDKGVHIADTLKSALMMMIREKSLKSALRLLSFKKRGSTIKSFHEPTEDGGYKFTCQIIEDKREIMDVSIILKNKSQLDRMEYNFKEKPEIVYRGLLAILSGEINYLINGG